MDTESKKENSKRILYVIVAVLVLASMAYRLLVINHFEQSTLLFIGLPALITILVIKFTGTPKSTYGITFKIITLFLLMSGVLLGEGIACIIFAAPLFYGVAALVIFLNDQFGRKNKTKLKVLAILPFVFFGTELLKIDEVPVLREVSVSRVITNNVSMSNLNASPAFMEEIPSFFKMGFPDPISIKGSGIRVGDFRKIEFESTTKGVGVLQLVIKEQAENKVVFEAVHDDTHIDHWLSWDEVEISLSPNIDGTTTVVWKTSFYCKLNPMWYFEPLERYAIAKSSNYLIDSYFGKSAEPKK